MSKRPSGGCFTTGGRKRRGERGALVGVVNRQQSFGLVAHEERVGGRLLLRKGHGNERRWRGNYDRGLQRLCVTKARWIKKGPPVLEMCYTQATSPRKQQRTWQVPECFRALLYAVVH